MSTTPSAPPPPDPRMQAGGGELAQSYQPHRVAAAILSAGWNVGLAALACFAGWADELWTAIAGARPDGPERWLAYMAAVFALHGAINFPIDLWFGHLIERRFGLAKSGVRAWGGDWLLGIAHNGAMFIAGGLLILSLQRLAPDWWVPLLAGASLILFTGTTWAGTALLPRGLFNFEAASDALNQRLRALAGAHARSLPPVIVYTASHLREFAGGLVGLGRFQRLLISRAAADLASDDLLRFILLHELGHRRFGHLLLSALVAWATCMMGVSLFALWSAGRVWSGTASIGTPAGIVWMAMWLTAWMILTQPVLAYLGRRLEYQADRHYLRCGGTQQRMQSALSELSARNLARTDRMRRRQSAVHPLPTVANRLHAAKLFEQRSAAEEA